MKKQYQITKEILEEIAESLKPLSSAKELVEVGVAGSEKTLANDRYHGRGIDFIRVRGRVLYSKGAILDALKRDGNLMTVEVA